MYYAIDDNLMARLKACVALDAPKESCDRAALLQELADTQTDPILSCLLWTKRDLVSEFRALLHGPRPLNSDGTFFDKTVAFADPLHERLASEMAGNVDEFCLGIRNDVDTDMALAAADALRNAVIEALEDLGIASYDAYISSTSVIAAYFARLSPTLVAEGFQSCVRHVADAIRIEMLADVNNNTTEEAASLRRP